MIGTTVGKYRILDRLGRGGMGIVYRALDETLDREVAIKVLNPDVTDSELLKRFRAEAVSLARLNHPGIATIYELHRQGDDLLMVMEFVRGQTLQALSEQLGPIDPPHAAYVCVQILEALAHAHRAGIVHRDLKPANVMMTDSGQIKVMDFGIARMLGGESMTHAGYMMGTPAYMAPEQVLGQEIDGRADLYSVGVLFYRLLSRELPFQAENAIAMAQKQVADEPTPIHTFRPNLPPWCEAIIGRALAKAPADRFPTAEAFRAAIRAAVTPESFGDLPTMATPTPMLLRPKELTAQRGPSDIPTMTRVVRGPAAPPDTAVPTTVPTTPPAPSPDTLATPAAERTGTTIVLTRGHMVSLVAIVAVLIVGIAALGFAALRGRAADPSTSAAPPNAEASTDPGATSGAPPAPETAPPVAPPPAPSNPPPAVRPPADGAKGAAVTAAAATKAAKPEAEVKDTDPIAAPPAESTAPAVAAITFRDVRMLVPQGDTMREREVILTLAGDRLSLVNPSDQTELLSLPYSAIVQPFYSRSKQPKWKGADGKEQTIPVDLGRMSFFRGERNWVIFTTNGEPVFVRFEDGQLRGALAAVQERTGMAIQR